MRQLQLSVKNESQNSKAARKPFFPCDKLNPSEYNRTTWVSQGIDHPVRDSHIKKKRDYLNV